MTEFVKQKPDYLAATTVPTDAEIAAELAQGRERFDLVHRAYLATLSDPNHPEANWTEANDIAFMRRAIETAPAYYELEDRAIVYMDKKRFG